MSKYKYSSLSEVSDALVNNEIQPEQVKITLDKNEATWCVFDEDRNKLLGWHNTDAVILFEEIAGLPGMGNIDIGRA